MKRAEQSSGVRPGASAGAGGAPGQMRQASSTGVPVAISWLIAIVVLVGLGLYAWEVRHEFDFLSEPRWVWLLPLIVASILSQFFGAYLYGMTLRKGGCDIGAVATVHTYAVGRLLNFAIPQSGNIYRATHLKRVYAFELVDFWRVFVAVAWLEGLVAFALCALLFLLAPGIGDLASLATTALVLAWASAPLTARLISRSLGAGSAIGWKRKLTLVALDWRQLFESRRFFIQLVSLSILNLLSNAARCYFALAFLSSSDPGLGALIFALVNRLSTLVLLTPGNIGIQEAMYVAANAMADESVGPMALAAAVILRISLYAVLLTVALSTTVWMRRRNQ